MWDKRLHATHIVSNLTFSAPVVRDWITRMRARGVTVPVLLGVPGSGRAVEAAGHGDEDRRR